MDHQNSSFTGYNPKIIKSDTNPSTSFYDNLEELALENKAFRKVLYTAKHSQIVLMSLLPNEILEREVHDNDQHFKGVDGAFLVLDLDSNTKMISNNRDEIVVRANTPHIVIAGPQGAKLITRYCPAHHPYDLIQEKKSSKDDY